MKKKELALERLHRNGLVKPFDSIEACVYSLVGIQSQVQQFAELAIWNRCAPPPTTKALSREYNSYQLINAWGQRNTLHTYMSKDWDTICDIYHNRAYMKSRIPHESPTIKKGVMRVSAQQSKGHLLNRELIHELVNEEGLDGANSALTTYLYLNYLSTNGVLFGVPAKPRIEQFAFSAILDKAGWHHDPKQVDTSLDTMMLRYFTYYGPATMQDFCHWSGLPMGLAKSSLERIEARLKSIDFGGRTYYSYGEVEVKATKKLTLLGKYDPLFVSYRHKDWIVSPHQEKHIWRNAGHIESVVLDGTRVIGTWRHTLKGNTMSVCVEPLSQISGRTKGRIEAKAARVARFWGKDLARVEYGQHRIDTTGKAWGQYSD